MENDRAVLLFVVLLSSVIVKVHCAPASKREFAESLKWSKDSVQADLKAVEEHGLEEFFRIEKYCKCVVSNEIELLDVAAEGLSHALGQVLPNGEVAFSLHELEEVLDGNGRRIVESSESISGLLHFKSRFGDVLSMSLSSPGDKNFAKRVEEIQRAEPKISPILDNIKTIPTTMLEKFNIFASAEICAADIRK